MAAVVRVEAVGRAEAVGQAEVVVRALESAAECGLE
jgi:hypothetical protein